MKKKFLILTLCFTIIFSSINLKKSYADYGVISLPILATVSSLAVGSGIVLSGNDDLFDIGRLFYSYIDRHNDFTWDIVQSLFTSSVSLYPQKYVSVDSKFLDIVKEFFDYTFSNYDSYDSSYLDVAYVGGIPVSPGHLTLDLSGSVHKLGYGMSYYVNNYKLYFTKPNGSEVVYSLGKGVNTLSCGVAGGFVSVYGYLNGNYSFNLCELGASVLSPSIPYVPGSYNWDNLESKKENESISLPIPGDLGSLVGQTSDKFWANSDNLVSNGDISIPQVNSPSIDIDSSITFPEISDTDVPDVNNPSIDKPNSGLEIFPPWGGGIDFSPVTQSSFTDKFPFSLASDIKNILDVFDVEPIPPKFTVPILGEEVNLDLTEFNVWASIVRFFVLIGFIISLINITRKVIG